MWHRTVLAPTPMIWILGILTPTRTVRDPLSTSWLLFVLITPSQMKLGLNSIEIHSPMSSNVVLLWKENKYFGKKRAKEGSPGQTQSLRLGSRYRNACHTKIHLELRNLRIQAIGFKDKYNSLFGYQWYLNTGVWPRWYREFMKSF